MQLNYLYTFLSASVALSKPTLDSRPLAPRSVATIESPVLGPDSLLPPETHLGDTRESAPSEGAEVIPGSDFANDMEALISGTLSDIDWTLYTIINGAWARTPSPSRRDIDAIHYGIVCAYADSDTCDWASGYSFCWRTVEDGDCLALYDRSGYRTIWSFYRKFSRVNIWPCHGDSQGICKRGWTAITDGWNGDCVQAPEYANFTGLWKRGLDG